LETDSRGREILERLIEAMKKYIHGIGPCYVLTSGRTYIKRYKWALVQDEDQTVRISKESKLKLTK